MCTDVYVDDDTLRLAREAGIPVSHGHGHHLSTALAGFGVVSSNLSTNLIRASDDARKLVVSLLLALSHCLDYAGMIGAEVDEAMGDSRLPEGLEESRRGGIHAGMVYSGGCGDVTILAGRLAQGLTVDRTASWLD